MCEIVHTRHECKHVAQDFVRCGVAWCRPITQYKSSKEPCETCKIAAMPLGQQKPKPKSRARKFAVVALASSIAQRR